MITTPTKIDPRTLQPMKEPSTLPEEALTDIGKELDPTPITKTLEELSRAGNRLNLAMMGVQAMNTAGSCVDRLNLSNEPFWDGIAMITDEAQTVADEICKLTAQTQTAFKARERAIKLPLKSYSSIDIDKLPHALKEAENLKFLFFIHQSLVTVQRRREELDRLEQ
jgi:hypothetical protein